MAPSTASYYEQISEPSNHHRPNLKHEQTLLHIRTMEAMQKTGNERLFTCVFIGLFVWH